MLALLATAFAMTASPAARQNPINIVVRAVDYDYTDTPVRALIDMPRNFAGASLMQKDTVIPSQTRIVDGKVELCWIVRQLSKGHSEKYNVRFDRTPRPPAANGVVIAKNGLNLDIRINNDLFTRYDNSTGPNKPYFYPIKLGGKSMTRHWPLEKVDGETNDHPHHRGLWFTHGEVNGVDYWSEGDKTGSTKTEKIENIQSGSIYGSFTASTNWVAKDGTKVAEDIREVTIFNTVQGRVMDFSVTVKATSGPLKFGDTKEGSFGLRVPDSIRPAGGMGHIISETGEKDAATWGKRAKWVDYYGPVEGETLGVAIFDCPTNPRYPTYWHVRDYGLFAANPFGIHDFVKGQTKGAGDIDIPAGGTLTFKYRVFFHKGDTADAQVASAFNAFAQPPVVEVR